MLDNLDQYPIIDGFLLDTNLKPSLTWRNMALANYEDVRRAGSLKARHWCTPLDTNIVIPARDSYEYQVFCKPGSVIVMWSFLVSQRVLAAGGNFSVRIKEACNDTGVETECLFGATGTPNPTQRRLPRPIVIATPGILNVEICSLYDEDSEPGDCQLVLWGGEPVE